MNADRKPHVGPERFDAHGLRGFLVVAAGENHQRTLDPRIASAPDHLVQIGGEYFIREMAMGVDHFQFGQDPDDTKNRKLRFLRPIGSCLRLFVVHRRTEHATRSATPHASARGHRAPAGWQR